MDNEDEGARLTRREENRELIAKHRATVEPKGCPTPGACSCPGTVDWKAVAKLDDGTQLSPADTPVTDAVVKMHEAGWLSLGSSAPGAVKFLVEALEAFERELIDIKSRLLPQFAQRAERAENAKRMVEHERDALLEKLRAATTMPCAPSATREPPEEIDVLGKYDNKPCGEGITLQRQWWSGGTWLQNGDRVVVLRPRMKRERSDDAGGKL